MSRLMTHYTKSRTAFLCVDIQTPFRRQIANFDACVFVANRFAAVHKLIPEHTSYIVTEQYPKGLGHTDPAVTIPTSAVVHPKLKYSCLIPEVESAIESCDNVVLFGMEGHVCVMQTAAELLETNKRVFLAVDGLGSRNATDLKTALTEMGRWGSQITLTTSESFLFQMMRGADDKIFKHVLKLVVEQPPAPKII